MFLTRGCILVATAVVLCKSQNGRMRALILKRSKDEEEGGGLWTIPGGKVSYADLGEPQGTADHNRQWRMVLERALARELREEAGVTADPELFYPLAGGDLIFKRKDGTPTLVTTHYLLLLNKPEVLLNQDAVAYAWVTEDELERYQFIGDVAGDIRRAFAEVSHSFV